VPYASESDGSPRDAALDKGRASITSTNLTPMGIDIYAHWKGQTEKEEKAQVTGFSVVHGHVGYLREAYHGSPYATMFLCQEAFDADDHTAQIPARVLRERLPETLRLAEERQRAVYGLTDKKENEQVLKSFSDFVELCEQKEKETGEPVTIVASH
jgi:hypothetical protein